MRSIRIVGSGRAGGAFALALAEVGWGVELLLHGVPLAEVTDGVDMVLLCVPDSSVVEVAGSIRPNPDAVLAHCAGALTLDALDGHQRRASVHPLVSLPTPPVGAARLRDHAWFAVAGDPLAAELVADLGGRAVRPPEGRRVAYHAAAVVASNHLVALLGQVQRIAADVEVPLAAFLDLAAASLGNVADLGPTAALTGPVARGDWDTVRGHLAALDPSEREAYVALARAAARLVDSDVPEL